MNKILFYCCAFLCLIGFSRNALAIDSWGHIGPDPGSVEVSVQECEDIFEAEIIQFKELETKEVNTEVKVIKVYKGLLKENETVMIDNIDHYIRLKPGVDFRRPRKEDHRPFVAGDQVFLFLSESSIPKEAHKPYFILYGRMKVIEDGRVLSFARPSSLSSYILVENSGVPLEEFRKKVIELLVDNNSGNSGH